MKKTTYKSIFATTFIAALAAVGTMTMPAAAINTKAASAGTKVIHELPDCLPFEVDRRKEFAPVKNASGTDSVDTARELLRENGVTL